MIRQKQEATWPFLCVLACLFILSATSPRAWERHTASEESPSGAVAQWDPPAEQRQAAVADPGAPQRDPPPEPAKRAACPRPAPRRASDGQPVHVAEAPRPRMVDPAARVAGPEPSLVLPEPGPIREEPAAPPVPAPAAVEDTTNLAPLEPVEPRVASIPDRAPSPIADPAAPIRSPGIDAEPALELPSEPRPQRPPTADVPAVSRAPTVRDSGPPGEIDAAPPADEARPSAGADWPEPVALTSQLENLAAEPETGPWASAVLDAIRRLGPVTPRRAEEVRPLLDRLYALGRQSDELEGRLIAQPVGHRLRQVRFALHRRLELWRHVLADDGGDVEVVPVSSAHMEQLAMAVAELDAMTAHSPEGRAWRRFLLLDSLKELSARRRAGEVDEQRRLARRVLARLSSRRLSSEQRRFVRSGPVATVGRTLRAWVTEPIDPEQVLEHVEAYELTGLPSDARQLASDCQRLAFAARPVRRSLGQRLQTEYRNANLRIVLTEELLNRLMPARDPEYQWVKDTVLGSPVRGRSLSFTDVAVRAVDDPQRLRLALEVSGRVTSMTSATNGPATFYNRSQSVYVARKPMELGTFGIRLWPATVEVRNATQLRGLETDFDPIPLVGSIVQEVARSQHQAMRCEANREIEAKVARRAKAQIDNEADARLTQVSQRLRDRILAPAATMELGPEMIDARTADRRLTMRLRIGGEDQLGGSTPRPWAPSDSLASFQVHESAMNNFLERLDLAGRTFTLPQLREWVAAKINRPEFAERTSDHDEIEVTFAPEDPIVFRCQDGRISVTLSIVRLKKEPNVWHAFRVRAFYRPERDGHTRRLVRDGVVHLIGRLDMRSQIGLRGLFGKAFDRDKPIELTPERLSTDPRMADLSVNQFVIEDGWMGIAVGPKRPGREPRVAGRPGGTTGPIY